MKPTRRRKRPAGTGSIEKLPSGKFRGVIRVRGQKREHSESMEDRGAVEAWLHATAIRARRPRRNRDRIRRLEEMLEPYEAELRKRGCTASHIRQAVLAFRIVLRMRIELDGAAVVVGKIRLHDVDGPTLAAIRDGVFALGLAPSTVRHRLDRITSACRMAMEWGWTDPRPLFVRRPRLTISSRPDVYTDDEVRDLLLEAELDEDPRSFAAFSLACFAGLRAGEIFRFRPEDLDPLRGTLVVPVRGEDDKPKSGRERYVPVPERLVAAVHACQAGPGGRLIDHGTWEGVKSMTKYLRPVFQNAGVEGANMHRLRHWWATQMGRGRATMFELMEWGGWTDPALVKRYFHGKPGLQLWEIKRDQNGVARVKWRSAHAAWPRETARDVGRVAR